MKNSKTQKRSLRPYIHLPPIHKQSIISDESAFENSMDSLEGKRKMNKMSVPFAHLYNNKNKSRNNSQTIAKQNQRNKLQHPHSNNNRELEQDIITRSGKKTKTSNNTKNKKNKSNYFRDQTQIVISEENLDYGSSEPREKPQRRNRKLHTEVNIMEDIDFDPEMMSQSLNDNTLVDFKKKIEESKAFIKQEIVKRSKEKPAQQQYDSRKYLRKPKNNSHDSQNNDSSKNGTSRKKNTPKGINSTLFNQVNHILNSKLHAKPSKPNKNITTVEFETLLKEEQESKIEKLMTKIRKMSPQMSRQKISEEVYQKSLSPQKLKHQNNYSEWRKVSIVGCDDASYQESSFQAEHSRLSEIVEKNDNSLANYLESKKQLLKFGMRMHTQEK